MLHMLHTCQAWELRVDAARTLDRLASWRDTGSGPLLGIIANADERLPTILDNLGILPYFDFVVTSRQVRQYQYITSRILIANTIAIMILDK
jgi:FMN phosphatase YigB (HAD superfamily)